MKKTADFCELDSGADSGCNYLRRGWHWVGVPRGEENCYRSDDLGEYHREHAMDSRYRVAMRSAAFT